MRTHEVPGHGHCSDRRAFLKTMVTGATAATLAPRAATATRVDARPVACVPLGMLGHRLAKSGARLTGAGTPAYAAPFVLADVALSPARRFNEFSGDLSGRYIEALSVAPHGDPDPVAALLPDLLGHQRADGRFGSDALVFEADRIGPQHMALLWGNGRLLVGLLAYHERHPRRVVLDAARRLADFLVAVRGQCADPVVVRRVEGLGANGFICVTQLIEGLVMAARATGNRRYLEAAADIAPLLPPRGIQHSHGYLSTLRGVMMLHEATAEARWLEFVTTRYRDLVGSRDYTVYGSVLEYFGWTSPGVNSDDRERLLAASGRHPRDEGCSSADFVRLSLQLWRGTGDASYLDRAERALENSLLPNQWETGDFGSRVTFEHGLMPTSSAARCWWCCTMHGHRALADVLASTVVRQDSRLVVTLLGESRWSDGTADVSASREIDRHGRILWRIDASGLQSVDRLLVRRPEWARSFGASTEGSALLHAEGPFLEIAGFPGGRVVCTVEIAPSTRIVSKDGTSVPLARLGTSPVEGALFHGPWLLAVDEGREPLFFGEPWQENVVTLAAEPAPVSPTGSDATAPALALTATYQHGGFPGTQPVTLTPLSRLTEGPQRTMAAFARYRRA